MVENPYLPDHHFKGLLNLLMAMVQAPADSPIKAGEEWHNNRQTLAKKLAYHLHTMETIAAGTMLEIDGVSAPIVDHGSLKILARAVLENYIVFAFIYSHEDSETCRFRHMTWELAGLMDRQRRIAITAENREKLVVEKKALDKLREEIESHDLFKTHTKGAQKALVKKGDWRTGKPWGELAVEAGLNRQYFQNIYGYLCDYSHSSYAAALQVRDARSVDDEAAFTGAMLGIMNMVMAHFITTHSQLFEASAKTLAASPWQKSVRLWGFESKEFDRIYSDSAEPM